MIWAILLFLQYIGHMYNALADSFISDADYFMLQLHILA